MESIRWLAAEQVDWWDRHRLTQLNTHTLQQRPTQDKQTTQRNDPENKQVQFMGVNLICPNLRDIAACTREVAPPIHIILLTLINTT